MKRHLLSALCALPALAPVLAASASATTRDIGTLPIGHYTCALPGNAQGTASLLRPENDFDVANASSYRADGSGGSYLLKGDLLTLTSGPRRGQRYRKISANQLRLLDSTGADTPLRCVRLTGPGGFR